MKNVILSALAIALAAAHAVPQGVAPGEWPSWRGPQQSGASLERGLPESVDPAAAAPSWSRPLAGRGTPVIAGGRVYCLGYEGEGDQLRELIACLDAGSGRTIWEHRFTDFLTDVIYSRYAIGSPTVDPETRRVFCLTTAGLLCCFSADGELLWQHSMMSEYGRLTFPNGRTGAPLIDGDLAIVHVITTSWGRHAPARDRFFAFDKRTGESVWSSTPGGPPKDSSFSFPVVADAGGRRVLYAGLGGGHLVCVDVRTGDPIWRYQMAIGGVNASPLLYGDTIIAIHGKENVDTSTIGRMVALKRGAQRAAGRGPLTLDRSHERWRNELTSFTSSPVLAGNRVYQTVATGELCCVDADTGKALWHLKLAPDQIHASPAWGDGKLYVPMNNGSFHIVLPSDEGPKILQTVQLEGNCLAAPAIAGGRVFVHTTKRLYAFAGPTAGTTAEDGREAARGPAVRLQVIPADVLLRQGDAVPFRVRRLDADGHPVGVAAGITWRGLPPDGVTMGADGTLRIARDARPAAVEITAAADGSTGRARLRIVPALPLTEDFEDFTLRPHAKEPGVLVAPPPPYWVGAKLKWEVRERDGDKVLAKTLDRALFQRTMSFIGHPDMSGYTVQADILSDGNRRSMSVGGVVNQRYLIRLKGNHQTLEVTSNDELLKRSVHFRWRPGRWYRLKTRVDVAADGSGVVRAKAWPRDESEPEGWTIEVPHRHAHTHGSPGIYGFTPQSRFRIYLDNISVTPHANE